MLLNIFSAWFNKLKAKYSKFHKKYIVVIKNYSPVMRVVRILLYNLLSDELYNYKLQSKAYE